MKALEILKQYQDDIQMSIPNYVNLDEAIEELEELENRSCNNCKYYDGTQTCNKFIARSSYDYKFFNCIIWELK